MHYSRQDIYSLDKISRLNLINSITGVKPANLVGTISQSGQENLAIFSSVVHMGSNPALIGMMTRPVDEVPRDTYANIKETGFYTINHIHSSHVTNAHYTSVKFDSSVSEFEKCGFNVAYKNGFKAPFVSECKCQFGLELKEMIPIKLNGTILVIGEVQEIFVDESALATDLQIDLQELDTVGISGLNRYYSLKFEKELPYARLNDLPKF